MNRSAREPYTLIAVVGIGLAFGCAVVVQPTLVPVVLAACALAALGIAKPVLLVAAMFLGMLFDRAGLTGFKVDAFPITASKLAVLGSLGLWGVHVAMTRARALRWHPVLTALVGVTVVTAVCIAYSNTMKEGKFALLGLVMMSVLVALVYAALAEARLAALYRFLAVCLVAAIVLSVVRARGAGEAARATGTMGDPNEWATLVLLLTGLVIGGLAHDEHLFARPLRLALVLLAPLAILQSGSRSALVMSAVVFPPCLYVLRYRPGELLACFLAAGVGAPLVIDLEAALRRFGQLLQRLQGVPGPSDTSLEEREEILRQGIALFTDNWAMGVGPGNFARATGFISHEGKFRPAHNTYLEIASEQGVLGLTAALLFLATVAWTLWRGLRAAPSEEHRARVLGVAAGLGAVALMAATLGLLTFALAWLALGWGLAVVHQAKVARG